MSKRDRTMNRHQAVYQRLNAAFPRAFPLDDAEIRPLALSTRDDVSAWIERQGFDPHTAKALLGAVQQQGSRRTYQATVIAGAWRINLDGNPVEAVTPEGEACAQQKIAQILEKRAVRERQTTASTVKSFKPQAPAAPTVKSLKPVVAEPVKAMPTVMVKKRRKVVLPEA